MKSTKTFILFLLLHICLGIKAKAAVVDTVITHSAAMHKDIKAVVIKPADYSTGKKLPVLYLLHGFSGNYSDWIKKVPAITELADTYHILIVCPDGDYASWYFDSPVNKDSQYETYVASELVKYIDTHFATLADRKSRAITGLSMGGHGALLLAFKHQDIFGAAGSMSGGVDIRQFSDRFGIEQVLGKYIDNPQRWEQNSVVNMLYLIKPNSLAITFDCGYDDMMYASNQNLHQLLLYRKIPHDYTVRPGGHSWDYWANSITYQAMFFSKYFGNGASVKH
ncbi:alpha/beta hydrolase [Mucilaginibacter agri]|uniref:Esterase family protein n=1 Tax=Mucilaginibacter agri TaxID=2695265 RepID=A0A966DS42_9SPHI|nr:alpha/beta hydrolase family protein [Mucilaginibacter agri]NCD69743.1 esterase family protein [Mucilaginibacter agri]